MGMGPGKGGFWVDPQLCWLMNYVRSRKVSEGDKIQISTPGSDKPTTGFYRGVHRDRKNFKEGSFSKEGLYILYSDKEELKNPTWMKSDELHYIPIDSFESIDLVVKQNSSKTSDPAGDKPYNPGPL